MNFDYATLGYEALRGAAIAPAEVVFSGQCLTFAKNFVQNNPNLSRKEIWERLPRTLGGWYVGVGAHSTLLTTATAVQYLTYEVFMQHTGHRFASAFFAGASTAILASPLDMVMVTQNNLGCGALDAVRKVGSNLFKGYTHAAARDTIFVAGYKWLSPTLDVTFKKELGLPDLVSSLVSGVFAGIAAGVLSQPSDTISTVVKTSVTNPTLPTSGRKYIATFGLKAAYSSGALRYFVRVPIAVVIYSTWDRYSK